MGPTTVAPVSDSMTENAEETGGGGDSDLGGTLASLFRVLESRAVAYGTLERAFKTLVGLGSTPLAARGFAQAVAEVTSEFAACSETVRGIETQLRGHGREELAELVRAMQGEEEKKLKVTVQAQQLKKQYNEALAHGEDCNCGPEAHKAFLSSDVLYQNSLGALFRQKQQVVERINDLVSELREAYYAELEV